MRLLMEAAITFMATNMDELFILMTLYLSVDEQLRKREIILGQFLGLSFLIALSVLGSIGTNILPTQYLPLFGIIPIFLGVKGIIAYFNQQKKQLKGNKTSQLLVSKEPMIKKVLEITRLLKISKIYVASFK